MADLALDARSGGDVPPLAPVHLPEFGQSVSWLMCRNPTHGRFGVPFDSTARRGAVRQRRHGGAPLVVDEGCALADHAPFVAGVQ